MKKGSEKIIHLIAAARPNFMKIAPLYHALIEERWARPVIVHTGQHYDLNMSDVFFQDLKLPKPKIHLGVGSGSHAEQTGQVMIAYEKTLLKDSPDMVIVVGDVNSTMAATLAAVKCGIKVAHLEAGLRSFDRTMPEEINRLVTDALADVLWTPSPDADRNLLKEGIPQGKIERVGNIMIDSLDMLKETILAEKVYQEMGLASGGYGLITLHRPSNVDDPKILTELCRALVRISDSIPLVFPVHPRTRMNVEKLGLMPLLKAKNALIISEPISYIRFMNMLFNCCLAITDSGGIQEETTYLGIPCLTLRPNTERPITITEGSNRLCNLDNLEKNLADVISEKPFKGAEIDLWDGKTASRVVKSLKKYFKV